MRKINYFVLTFFLSSLSFLSACTKDKNSEPSISDTNTAKTNQTSNLNAISTFRKQIFSTCPRKISFTEGAENNSHPGWSYEVRFRCEQGKEISEKFLIDSMRLGEGVPPNKTTYVCFNHMIGYVNDGGGDFESNKFSYNCVLQHDEIKIEDNKVKIEVVHLTSNDFGVYGNYFSSSATEGPAVVDQQDIDDASFAFEHSMIQNLKTDAEPSILEFFTVGCAPGKCGIPSDEFSQLSHGPETDKAEAELYFKSRANTCTYNGLDTKGFDAENFHNQFLQLHYDNPSMSLGCAYIKTSFKREWNFENYAQNSYNGVAYKKPERDLCIKTLSEEIKKYQGVEPCMDNMWKSHNMSIFVPFN